LTVFHYLFWTNVVLFFLNMVPAFPMDGGKVIRAALAIHGDFLRATRVAAWLGRLVVFGALAYWLARWWQTGITPDPLLLVTSLVVYFGARLEEVQVLRQRGLLQITVGEVMRPVQQVVAPWDTPTPRMVRDLAQLGLVLPVMVGSRLVGLLCSVDVRQGQQTVAHVMRTDFAVLVPGDTLWVAARELSKAGTDGLPVIENEQLAGIVYLDDIQQAWRLMHRRRKKIASSTIA
jgi:CBS domain-containing protein